MRIILRIDSLLSSVHGFRSQAGATMVEAAICLPIFVLIVAGIIDFSTVLRRHILVLQAIAEAGRALSGVSSTEGISEADMLLKAGQVFERQTLTYGVRREELAIGANSEDEPYILIGLRYEFSTTGYQSAPPLAYELQASYTPLCFFCGFTRADSLTIRHSAVVILETYNRDWQRPPLSNQVLAYFPGYGDYGEVRAVSIDPQ